MPLRFNCGCGATLTVDDDAEGQWTRCPACQAMTLVEGARRVGGSPGPRASSEQRRWARNLVRKAARDEERSRQQPSSDWDVSRLGAAVVSFGAFLGFIAGCSGTRSLGLFGGVILLVGFALVVIGILERNT